MKKSSNNAFTLIELLVVISIIAILAGIALPVFGGVQTRGAQTKALNNCKQIGLALKMYAADNDGYYPDEKLTSGKRNGTKVANANEAFAQLIPTFLQNESIFQIPKSKWSPNTPDNKIDASVADTRTDTLKIGENAWGFVTALSESSDGRYPLVAEGAKDASTQYSADESDYGGVWKGKVAIILNNDQSAKLVKLSTDFYAKTSPTGADGLKYSSTDSWLNALSTFVNPAK